MRVRPKDVGLPFKEVPFISVGECINNRSPQTLIYIPKINANAHTHMCKEDAYRNCICVSHEELYRSRLVLWHEYAHVLTPRPYVVKTCTEAHGVDEIVSFNSEKDFKEWNEGHNPTWRKIMESFNLKAAKRYDWSELSDTW